MFSASLGASAAGAQSAPKANRFDGPKHVQQFLKRQARIVTKGEGPVFPNARITKTDVNTTCADLRPRVWLCAFSVYLYEESTIAPPAEYDPEWPIRQSTLRVCKSHGGKFKNGVHYVKQSGRKRVPSALRIVGGWHMSCALDESAISQWNKYGPDWQPSRSEPIPVAVVAKPVQEVVKATVNLLPPPSGQPAGAPPGPLSTTQAESASTARIASRGQFNGCTTWYPWRGYWVYLCSWRPLPLPGAQLGLFNTVTYYEAYYWATNDVYGRAVGRLFQQGTY